MISLYPRRNPGKGIFTRSSPADIWEPDLHLRLLIHLSPGFWPGAGFKGFPVWAANHRRDGFDELKLIMS